LSTNLGQIAKSARLFFNQQGLSILGEAGPNWTLSPGKAFFLMGVSDCKSAWWNYVMTKKITGMSGETANARH
jgi:hypothetical protein